MIHEFSVVIEKIQDACLTCKRDGGVSSRVTAMPLALNQLFVVHGCSATKQYKGEMS